MIDSYGVPGALLNCPIVESQFNTRVVFFDSVLYLYGSLRHYGLFTRECAGIIKQQLLNWEVK